MSTNSTAIYPSELDWLIFRQESKVQVHGLCPLLGSLLLSPAAAAAGAVAAIVLPRLGIVSKEPKKYEFKSLYADGLTDRAINLASMGLCLATASWFGFPSDNFASYAAHLVSFGGGYMGADAVFNQRKVEYKAQYPV